MLSLILKVRYLCNFAVFSSNDFDVKNMVRQFQKHFFAIVVLKQCKYVTFDFDLF